jgi:hypothetical protein
MKRSRRKPNTPSRKKAAPRRPRAAKRAPRRALVTAEAAVAREIDAVRAELQQLAARQGPPRWNADPEDVRRSVLKLVLTLVELIRQLLERQAIRRMDANTLTAAETEAVGMALMRLQETIHDLAKQFDLSPEELNLDLGPIGRLM